jgi:hypothetical protein
VTGKNNNVVEFKNGKLKWKDSNVEERRRNDDRNWEEVKNFIAESREYRAADSVRQEYIAAQVKKTNGRVDILEDFQKEIEIKIKDRKENRINTQTLITIIATVVMAISALVMIFKHG